jgi:hypothetical protein
MSAGPSLFTSAVETHDYHKGSAPWLDRDVDDANAVQTHHGASAFTHQAALGAPTPPATGVDWDAIAAVVTQHFAQTGEWVPYDQLVGSTSGGDGGAGHVGSDATEISYQTIDYPDAAETNVFGINNFGQSVGSFVQDSTPHAYFSSDDGFVPLDFPPVG